MKNLLADHKSADSTLKQRWGAVRACLDELSKAVQVLIERSSDPNSGILIHVQIIGLITADAMQIDEKNDGLKKRCQEHSKTVSTVAISIPTILITRYHACKQSARALKADLRPSSRNTVICVFYYKPRKRSWIASR